MPRADVETRAQTKLREAREALAAAEAAIAPAEVRATETAEWAAQAAEAARTAEAAEAAAAEAAPEGAGKLPDALARLRDRATPDVLFRGRRHGPDGWRDVRLTPAEAGEALAALVADVNDALLREAARLAADRADKARANLAGHVADRDAAREALDTARARVAARTADVEYAEGRPGAAA